MTFGKIENGLERGFVKHRLNCLLKTDPEFHHISNTQKRVENTTRSGVFLTNFEVFDIVMKHCGECLI